MSMTALNPPRIFEIHRPPQFTITAMLERSLLFEQMEENKAKLETLRPMLFESLGLIAQSKVCGDWRAISNMVDEVSGLERSIAEDQSTLDDARLWEVQQ